MKKFAKNVVSLCMAFVIMLGLVVVVMPIEVKAQQDWRWVVEPQFEFEFGLHCIDEFSEGLAAVRFNGLWGFIDTEGNIIIEPQFLDRPSPFRGGVSHVSREEGVGIRINRMGNETTQSPPPLGPSHNLASFYEQGLGVGFRDRAGNTVIEPQFSIAHGFSYEYGIAAVSIGHKWGLIDAEGNIVMDFQFAGISRFSEGLAGVLYSEHIDAPGLWGYIDTLGNIVIEPQFVGYVGAFSGGLAMAFDGNRAGFINTSGNWVVEPQFNWAMPPYNGIAFVQPERNGPWGLIAIDQAPAQPTPPTNNNPQFVNPPTNTDIGVLLEWREIPNNRYGYRIFRATTPTGAGISISDFPITDTNRFTPGSIITFDPNIRPGTVYYYYIREVIEEARFDIANVILTPEVLGPPSERVRIQTPARLPWEDEGNEDDLPERGFIMMTIGNPYMNVNNVWEEIDPGVGTAPIIENARTMVPIRAIVEAMGGTAAWDGSEQRADLTALGNNVSLWLGRTDILVNNTRGEMDVVPTMVNNRVLLPLRFVAESLDTHVEWIGSQRLIVIVFPLM